MRVGVGERRRQRAVGLVLPRGEQPQVARGEGGGERGGLARPLRRLQPHEEVRERIRRLDRAVVRGRRVAAERRSVAHARRGHAHPRPLVWRQEAERGEQARGRDDRPRADRPPPHDRPHARAAGRVEEQ